MANKRSNGNKIIKSQIEERDFEELRNSVDKNIDITCKDEINKILNKEIKLIAKNESQKELIQSIKNNEITICAGLPGSGKTFISVSYALNLLKKKESPYKRIYLVKSVTSLPGEELGFLPGDENSKIFPYMFSYYINIEKVISESTLKSLLDKKYIKPLPLAYIRGASLDDCIIILDECQNISVSNSKTFLSRIGENSKMIILGDINQVDLKNRNESSLSVLLEMFKNTENIGVVEMDYNDTSVRNPLINIIENKFNEYNNTFSNTNNKKIYNKTK